MANTFTLTAYCARMKARVYDTHADAFFRVFRVPLRRFWNNLTGFDIVAFDGWLQTPDGVNIPTHADARFGDGAGALIQQVLADEGAVVGSFDDTP